MQDPLDVDRALDVAQAHVRTLIEDHPGRVPTCTHGGHWQFDADSWAPVWTSGFLAGELWIFAERTGDPTWRAAAERYSEHLEHRKLDAGTHDIGFLFSPSWGRWHQVDPSPRNAAVLISAGRTMAARFNPHGRYLSTWVHAGSTFIDIMMNLDIIFQAAQLSGDAGLSEIAFQHALTTRRFLVRGDATTVHEGWFDPATGEFLRAATHQGYRSDSCWARGLAWGLYGFGSAYRNTHDERFLTTARSLARTYIERTGDAYIPPNDWDDPHPAQPYESSAACIAASGLLQLAELIPEQAATYAQYAAGVLSTLAGPGFLAPPDGEWEGIIRHAIYHPGNNLGVDESVMWGDYYFVEALWRLATSPQLRAAAGPTLVDRAGPPRSAAVADA
ncbi:glycoside hydrolase family 88 protein [Microbacterium kribbense]|uniref:Glycoside hydrolase family 88 protein n=1 Tax=Microbacterium kribbense TaxID=433645 RepID=A0ABP7GTK6_9MICO